MDLKQHIRAAYDSRDDKLFHELMDLLPVSKGERLIQHTCTVNQIQSLIKYNIPIEFNKYMLCAITYNNINVAQFLLENKYIDPNEKIMFNTTGKHETWAHIAIYAIYYNHYDRVTINIDYQLDIIKLLVSNGFNVHETNESGHTAIVYAMCHITNQSGRYPSIQASKKHMIIEYFVTNGSDPNTRDIYSYTPLNRALQSLPISREHVKFLLEHGADCNIVDSPCDMPLLWIIKAHFDFSLAKPIMLLLLEFGADPFLSNGKCECAMSVARGDLRDLMREWLEMPVKGVMNG